MSGFGTTPEQLTSAAAAIGGAVGGDVGSPPDAPGGAAYGHADLAAAVSVFGSALRTAAQVLVREAQAAADGLGAGARGYTDVEQANAAALRTAGSGGRS